MEKINMGKAYYECSKRFTKALLELGNGSETVFDTFRNFCDYQVMAFRQANRILFFGKEDETLKKETRKILKKYKSAEGLRECLEIVAGALSAERGNFLGEWASNERLLNARRGQFFTPYNMSLMMAEIIIGSANNENGNPISICEPACGSGAMIIAADEVLRKRGKQDGDYWFMGIDIDWSCCAMGYI